jgi:uncharacterized protein YabE (DUF348 family)
MDLEWFRYRRNQVLLSSILILVLAILFAFRVKSVGVLVDGRTQVIETRAVFVRGALRDAGISLRPKSEVIPGLNRMILGPMVVQVINAIQVHIWDGDLEIVLESSDRTPSAWLAEAEVYLDTGDAIYIQGRQVDPESEISMTPYLEVFVRRAVDFDTLVDDQNSTLTSTATTLVGGLYANGLQLRRSDWLSLDSATPLSPNLQVHLEPATSLAIKVDGQTQIAYSAADTVGTALVDAGFTLQGLDYSIPTANQSLPADGAITVVRVNEVVEVSQKLLPFETQTQLLTNVPIDTAQVVQVGAYGVEAQQVRVRYENAEEASRTVEDAWIVQEPQPRIEGYGSQIEVKTLSTPDGVIEYWRALEFYATSYSASRAGVSPDKSWYGHVYCGGLLDNGMVAVDLGYIPCGTPLYIPGYGYAVAMDTGNIDGAWIDLGYADDDFVNWHQYVTVYFLTPVPPLENIAFYIPPGTFH